MAHPYRWLVLATCIAVPLACADRSEEIRDEEVAGALEREGTLEVPPDESATGAVLHVEERAGLGRFLADRDSRAVYLFTGDEGAEGSACYDACAERWPPVIVEGGELGGSAGVRSELLGTLERRDGRTQATYNGHPLYAYVGDAGPGEITGQDMEDHGGEWYLVTPQGTALEDEQQAGEG